MKTEITLLPLIGVEFDGHSLRFGMTRAAAEAILGGAQRSHKNRCYYLGGELALDFDAEDGLEFIEFLGGAEGTLRPDLYGLSVFDTDAQELLEVLEKRRGPCVDEDGGYTVTVPALSIGLYREISPADVEGLIREMSKMDVTTLGHVDLAAEQRRCARWDTIGLGKPNYYA